MDSLQRVVAAMAQTPKTYALVYRDNALVGIFS